MSARKKLQNKEKFKFDENDVLPPLPKTVTQKSSVQSRLFKKANYDQEGSIDSASDKKARSISLASPKVMTFNNKNLNQVNNNSTEKRETDEAGSCPCDRPLCLVMCVLCKASSPGRVSLPCVQHPRAVFLQDLQRCSSCKQGDQTNLVEFEMPRGMKEAMQNVASKK